MGSQATGIVPPELLHGQPTSALHETALDLAEVDCRVQRFANIVQDVDAQQAVFAGQCVDDGFRDRSAIGEIVERSTPGGLAVPFLSLPLMCYLSLAISYLHPHILYFIYTHTHFQ